MECAAARAAAATRSGAISALEGFCMSAMHPGLSDSAPVHRLGEVEQLGAFVAAASRLLVLTGAGVSTESGIPDYRGPDGAWKHRRPILYQDFVRSEDIRRRYWARSTVGWRRVSAGQPNAAHQALAALEALGPVHHLVTQNVDGLHQQAGSRRVIDLHGRLDEVECLGCGARIGRAAFQARLEALNPAWQREPDHIRPDGDAELPDTDYGGFQVPECARCGGVLKPSVVFFGENVPRPRLALALEHLGAADALLVVGSSLMVFSGYRFVREARRAGKRIALVNQGRTRADAEVDLKVEQPCGPVLHALASGRA